MSALKDLIAAVEADSTETLAWRQIFGWDETLNADAALKGSLDAAKALHEAVLPGWGVSLQTADGFGYVMLFAQDPARKTDTVENAIPARAWLLAILKALESKNADA